MTPTTLQPGMDLIISGALLFVIGLVQGVFIPKFENSRMALSAHLTAVQCGTGLMVFGVIWTLVKLPSPWLGLTEAALISSFYLIWLGISIAAATGASKALPIAGAGYSGSKASEHLVTLIESTGVVLSVASGIAIMIGLVSVA